MGKTVSRLTRPLRNWNIESRAHKAISKEKRPTAPFHESVHKQIQLVEKLNPEYKEYSQRKDSQLDDNLKKLFITSTEGKEIDSRYNPDRPLPRDNTVHEGFEFGFYEPTKVPEGKVTLRQALEFITKHNRDPTNYTAEVVSKDYKIDKETAVDILEHFKIFRTHKENPEDEVESYALPLSLRSGIRIKHSEVQRSAYEILDDGDLEGIYKETHKEINEEVEKKFIESFKRKR